MPPKRVSNLFKKSTKGKSQDMDWDAYFNEFCVAEEGWQYEPKKVWSCTTCREYIKMSHIAKLWPADDTDVLERQVRRWEGPMNTCRSEHFKRRYEEIWAACKLGPSKPNIMNYSTMAMIWAEIVLQKDVDWRTVPAKDKKTKLTCDKAVIDTNWVGPSDCMPQWSNRGQFGFPVEPLPDAEDDDDEDDEEDLPPPPPLPERHERREEREDIDFQNQMREAMRNSVLDQGRPRQQWSPPNHDRDVRGSHYGGSSRHNYDPYDDFRNVQGSHGSTRFTDYGGSQYGGSQFYSGIGGQDSYRPLGSSYYMGSSERGARGSEHNAPPPPPPFGGPYFANYGQGGTSSGHGPYSGSGSMPQGSNDGSSSDSE